MSECPDCYEGEVGCACFTIYCGEHGGHAVVTMKPDIDDRAPAPDTETGR